MFFEVHSEAVVHLRGSTFKTYKTKISRTANNRAIAILALKDFTEKIPTGFLWWIMEFEENPLISDIHIHRMYPFWIDVRKPSWYESGKDELLWKWIWWAIECILLSQFSADFSLSHDSTMTLARREQLKKYWAIRPKRLSIYIWNLSSALSSPHFKIIKFPDWITEPEILQLSEKV